MAFALVVLISYFSTSGYEHTTATGEYVSAAADHWTGAGLVAFYILAALAILSMVFSGVKKLIS